MHFNWSQLGFQWNDFVQLLFTQVDGSSLAFNRIVVGLLLFLDIIHERGLSRADIIWTDDEDPEHFQCRFPLFESITRFTKPEAMYAVYLAMVLGITGVILGFHYRLSCFIYSLAYWYLFVIEKSRWNNHSYLFGLLSLINLTNNAHCKWSLDSRRSAISGTVPFWQYFVLRFQIFLVYFYAGVKKINLDWLRGYSMISLSSHWIWAPAKWMHVPGYWIDYYVIHLGGWVFDSLVGFLFIYRPTRPLAFLLCGFFNLANSQMFQIGMFPWVMLAVMPIFCDPDWPIWLAGKVKRLCIETFSRKPDHSNTADCFELEKPQLENQQKNREFLTILPEIIEPEPEPTNLIRRLSITNDQTQECFRTKAATLRKRNSRSISVMENLKPEPQTRPSRVPSFFKTRFHSKNLAKFFGFEFKKYFKNFKVPAKIPTNTLPSTESKPLTMKNRLTVLAILLYILLQLSLPFAYPLLPGYNTWTNGPYGYSWDMMVHNWNHLHTRVTVKAVTRHTHQPVTYYLNPDSWTLNARWSHHADMVYQFAHCVDERLRRNFALRDIELYLDVWTSLNGRFTQRMYRPKQDILALKWSPFEQQFNWVLPILGHSEEWRSRLEAMDRQIESNFAGTNGSFLVYIADIPGLPLENYIDETLFTADATLIVLCGLVRVQLSNGSEYFTRGGPDGQVQRLPLGTIATVTAFGGKPAYYALLYASFTGAQGGQQGEAKVAPKGPLPAFTDDEPLLSQQIRSRNSWLTSVQLLVIGGRFAMEEGLRQLMKAGRSVVAAICEGAWRWLRGYNCRCSWWW